MEHAVSRDENPFIVKGSYAPRGRIMRDFSCLTFTISITTTVTDLAADGVVHSRYHFAASRGREEKNVVAKRIDKGD